MSKGAESLMTNIFHVGIDQFDGIKNRGKRHKSTLKAGKSLRLDDKDIIKREKTKKKYSCLVKN